jgi:hypothetical protein
VTVSVPTIDWWNEQWYPLEAAALNFIGVLVAPGAMLPVSNVVAVAVCAMLSALCQLTVCPTFAVTSDGENDIAPYWPLMVIVTSAAAAGVGVGVGFVEGVEP